MCILYFKTTTILLIIYF